MPHVLYVLACLVVPMVWGLIVVWISNRIDAWAKARSQSEGNAMNPDDATRVEYHI